MTYAMTLDNSWELMSEEEMYEVNGGGQINIIISRDVIMDVAGIMAGGGTTAVVGMFLAPKITLAVGMWLLVSTSLGPVGMAAISVFAAGAVTALIGYIASQAARYLAGHAYDAVFTVASGILIPNVNLRLG